MDNSDNTFFTLDGLQLDEAKKMVKNYTDKLRRNANGKVDETISVWFSLEQLENLIDRLKRERTTSATQSPTKVTSGLRIYFANYGINVKVENPKYQNQNTLVLVSTHKDEEEGKHKDYFHEGSPALMGIATNPENRGMLCPPDDGCDCCTEILEKDISPCKC